MRRSALILLVSLASFVVLPVGAVAEPNNESATYELHLEVPNVAQAPNGDRVAVTGEGEFSVHPKSAEAEGTFTHTTSSGAVVGSGSWTATDLLEFQPYGCGVVHNFPNPGDTTPLPPNFCGGAVKLRVLLTPSGTTLEVPAILTVFCIIGPNPPNSHDDPSGEGITLVVPGGLNFNQMVSGMNIYIRTS